MQLQFRRTPVAADVDIEALVAQTTGFSGAEVGMQPACYVTDTECVVLLCVDIESLSMLYR